MNPHNARYISIRNHSELEYINKASLKRRTFQVPCVMQIDLKNLVYSL